MRPNHAVLEKLCKDRGVTAAEVARNIGVWQSTLSDWKAGRSAPKTDTMAKLAKYFDVPIEYFLKE